jgi:hypothetical protein
MGSVDGKAINIEGEEFKIDYKDGIVSIGGNKLSTEPIAIESSVSSEYEISKKGLTFASDDNAEVFTIVSGSSYSHKINNFDIFKDKLDFGEGVTADDLTIKNDADDGKVYLEYTPDKGATTVNIELTGLSLKDDALLSTKDGVNNILNGFIPDPTDDPTDESDDYVNDTSIGDAGDSIEDATKVELISSSESTSEFIINGYLSDSDNYSFVSSSDGKISIDLYGMSSDLDLLLYNGDEEIASSTDGEDYENISFDVTAGENYTISIDHATVTADPDVAITAVEPENTDYNLYAWLKSTVTPEDGDKAEDGETSGEGDDKTDDGETSDDGDDKTDDG